MYEGDTMKNIPVLVVLVCVLMLAPPPATFVLAAKPADSSPATLPCKSSYKNDGWSIGATRMPSEWSSAKRI
jgi:hypothetical protein